jgi:hypothetical protein
MQRKVSAAGGTGAQPADSPSNQYRWLLVASWIPPLLAVLLIVVYSIQYDEQFISVATTGVLVALAALVVAALGGFLFGIPRALQRTPSVAVAPAEGATRYAVNTNLEDISD